MQRILQTLKWNLLRIEEVTITSREWYEYVNLLAEEGTYPQLLRALHRARWGNWYPNLNGVPECEITMNLRGGVFMEFVAEYYGL